MFDFSQLTDLNGDGVIDQLDMALAEKIGDLNGDGIIDQQDMALAGIDLADIAASFNAGLSDLPDIATGLDANAGFESGLGGSPSDWSGIAPQGVSFGSSSLSPAEWRDGAAYGDITPENMDAMADQMVRLFTHYGVDTYAVNGLENASMAVEGPEFFYDPNLMWAIGQRYGTDAITGLTGHEIGHHIVETKLADNVNVTDWQHELCADYISGIVSQLHGVDHEVMHDLYADPDFSPASYTHPSGGLRAQAYDMGVEWAQNSTNSAFHEFLLTNEFQLESMFEGILDLFPGSYSEYIDL